MVRRRRDERDAGGGAAQPGDVRGDLVAGQLAALARLGALGDLDLELAGAGQVGRGDAEAAGGDLADLRGGPVAVLKALEVREPRRAPRLVDVLDGDVPRGVLPALARVGAAVDARHRHGDGLVRLTRERAERHAAGAEAWQDGGDRLDVVHLAGRIRRSSVRRPVADQPQQVAQHGRRPLRELLAVAAVQVGQPLDTGAAQRLGRLGVVEVVLAARPVAHEPVVLQLLDGELGERLLVDPHRLLRELLDAEAADARGSAEEPELDEVRAEADRLEQLRAVVAGQQRDAHLGEDLEQALLGGDAVVAQGLLEVGGRGGAGPLSGGRRLVAEPAALPEVAHRLEGEVRVHGRGAVADEAGEVVDAPALRRLGDERGPAAQASPDQVVVHGADGEQRRHVARAGHQRRDPVAEDDDLDAVAHRGRRLAADALDGLAQAPRPAGDLVGGRDPDRRQPEVRERGHLRLVDDRRRQLDLPGVLRPRREQVAARPQLDGERHDEPLAQRVDRRVGHLGEALGEVVVEHVRLAREDRQRRVVAHGEAGLPGLTGHGPDDELDVLGGEAGRRLAAEQGAGVAWAGGRRGRSGRGGRGGGRRRVGAVVLAGDLERLRRQGAALREQPGAVRATGRDGGLDDVVAHQPPVLEVDGDHLAGAEPALLDDLLARQVHGAGLGGEREQAGAGERVARRAQAVAVDAGAEVAAVGEGDQRRPVPGLLHAGVEVVEVGDARVGAGRLVLVRRRHRHHQRLERAAAAAHEQLDQLVQGAGVAAVAVHGGQQLGDSRAPHRSRQLRLPGAHPRQVAEQGVDLAVVGQQPHRLREAPLGRRVGAEAAVQDRIRADERRVPQVRIELGQHLRRHHALVDDGPRRERADVEVVQAADDGLAAERPADGPAGQEQGALQLVPGEHR